jgi:F-type H+-transporting ATPase subunit O
MSKTPRSLIATTVAEWTLSGGITKRLTRQLAAYLLSENRTSELDPLMRDVQGQWAKQGYVNALAISAHPIDAKNRSLIQKAVAQAYPKAKTVVISESHDASVIGGVRIELSDRQLDLSVATKLNKFKQLTTGKD